MHHAEYVQKAIDMVLKNYDQNKITAIAVTIGPG